MWLKLRAARDRVTVGSVSTAQLHDVATRFLEALERRDFDALAETFAPDGKLRGLVPSALREAEGREAIAERFRMNLVCSGARPPG